MEPPVADFCRLILLRHPEPDPKYADLAVGGGDAAIGRRGQEQVHGWLAKFAAVRIDAVYAGTQPQCVDPARALAAHLQVGLEQDPRLDDQDMGRWQGRPWSEVVREEGEAVREFFGQLGEAAAPGGESLGAAIERMLAFWHDTAPGGLGKQFVVVTSGAMIGGFAAAMLGMRLSRSISMGLPYGAIGVLDCFANGARVTSWNPDGFPGT